MKSRTGLLGGVADKRNSTPGNISGTVCGCPKRTNTRQKGQVQDIPTRGAFAAALGSPSHVAAAKGAGKP